MKVGIIGAGRIGAIRADILSDHRDVSSIVVTDEIPAQSQRIAAATGAIVASGPDELLEAVDAVIICTPADMHVDSLFRIAQAGSNTCLRSLVIANPSQRDRRRIRSVFSRSLERGCLVRQYSTLADLAAHADSGVLA